MKVKVNQDCIGCGMCVDVCPEVFQIDVDGYSTVVGEPDAYVDKVWEAVEVCPVNAIEAE